MIKNYLGQVRRMVFSFLVLFLVQGFSAQSFLHTRGKDIVDETGKKILLRGVGLGNWMLPEGYMWKFGNGGDRPRKIEKIVEDCIGHEKADKFWKSFRENYITEADIKRIAELGYNSVRPALNSRLFLTEGDNNIFVDEGFTLLDNLISWCKKYHIYVIIDMHGAPGGQTGQNIDDSPNDEPELFMNPKNQYLLERLWVKIADRYKDEPTVAAFDLLNEPLPERTGAAEKYKHQLVILYQRLIKAIRTVDKNHMFTVEGYNWSNNWSLFEIPLDNNIVYQFHYYCWNKPDNLNSINQYLVKQQQLNVPVWVGETGEKNNAIYFATTQYFEKNNIGWSFWPWKKMATKNTPYSIKMPHGWSDIMAYSEGAAKKVSKVAAEKIFDELIENIKLNNCNYFPDVVNAMFRMIPLRVEAENYGDDGYQKSYFVKDTVFKSAFYRTKEPIQVNPFGKDSTEQAIKLAKSEWVVYNCKALKQSQNNVTLHAKALSKTAEIRLSINGKDADLKIESTKWQDLNVNDQPFKTGENQIKVFVKTGNIQLDWIDIQ